MARYDSYGSVDDQYKDEIDSNFKGFNNRLRPDALPSGILASSENFRFDLEGVAVQRKGITNVSAPFTVDTNTALTLPFYLYADDTASGATRGTNIVTIAGIATTTGTDATVGIINDTMVSVTGMTGLGGGYVDGINYKATRVSATSISISVPGVTGTAGGTIVVGAPKLSGGSNTDIKGSCSFVDPSTETEYIMLVSNAKAVAVKVSDASTSDFTYPSGRLIDADVSVIQAFGKILIFEEGRVPLAWDLNFSNEFVNQESGSFTDPEIKSTTNDCSIENGKVTVVMANTGATALNVGDEIIILDKGGTALVDQDIFQIGASSATEFSFFAPAADVGASGAGNGVAIKLIARISGGAGFTHAPAPRYGVVHSNRIVVPFEYEVDASDESYTKRSPAVTDELLVSYPFNPEKYDTTYSSFTVNANQNDSIVNVFSFADGKLVVFLRNSIAIITNVDSFNQTESITTPITRDLGLVAKDSIAQVGNQILFLSDNGVYGLSFEDLYNLRGNDVPLSEPINETIQSINKSAWENSTAVYFDNRYYIAVPIGDNQITNNTVLVYNFLNKQWESKDTVGDPNWDIQKLLVAGRGNSKGVYAINSQGGVHRLDSTNGGLDSVITSIGTTSPTSHKIVGKLITRQFNLGAIDRKKWNQMEIVMGSQAGLSIFDIDAVFENRDATATLVGIPPAALAQSETYFGATEGNGVSTRARIGNYRAYGMTLDLTTQQGQPILKFLKVSGAFAFKSLESIQ